MVRSSHAEARRRLKRGQHSVEHIGRVNTQRRLPSERAPTSSCDDAVVPSEETTAAWFLGAYHDALTRIRGDRADVEYVRMLRLAASLRVAAVAALAVYSRVAPVRAMQT
jgi:hypothetical protein